MMCSENLKSGKPCQYKGKAQFDGKCGFHSKKKEVCNACEEPIRLEEANKLTSKVLYSKGDNNECYTQDVGVYPILKFIPKDAVVWCPFDKAEISEFVKQISKTNKVISSHIDDGQDF